jgi:RimJ/RimL family protein N-acetyltransferase
VGADEVDALVAGQYGGRTLAPGWPTADTGAGLGFATTGGSVFLVIDDDGRVAGECGTKRPVDAAGTVEIGYGLAAGSRGHGLGTAAVTALVDWLRTKPEVRVVTAEVHVDNTPSRRVVERLGFRIYDGPVDGYVYYRLDLRH